MSTAPVRLLTEQEYLARERKAAFKSEFYRGEMFAMAGATREHNLIAGNVFYSLRRQLDERPCEVYSSDMRVRVTPSGLYTYPDVAVACGGPQFADAEGDVLLNPTVLVEVLSPSSANYDRGDKATHYRRLDSLRELLLVEQEFYLVEHLIRQADDSWLIRGVEGPSGSLELASIGCRLTMQEIYAKVALQPDARPPLRFRADAGP